MHCDNIFTIRSFHSVLRLAIAAANGCLRSLDLNKNVKFIIIWNDSQMTITSTTHDDNSILNTVNTMFSVNRCDFDFNVNKLCGLNVARRAPTPSSVASTVSSAWVSVIIVIIWPYLVICEFIRYLLSRIDSRSFYNISRRFGARATGEIKCGAKGERRRNTQNDRNENCHAHFLPGPLISFSHSLCTLRLFGIRWKFTNEWLADWRMKMRNAFDPLRQRISIAFRSNYTNFVVALLRFFFNLKNIKITRDWVK